MIPALPRGKQVVMRPPAVEDDDDDDPLSFSFFCISRPIVVRGAGSDSSPQSGGQGQGQGPGWGGSSHRYRPASTIAQLRDLWCAYDAPHRGPGSFFFGEGGLWSFIAWDFWRGVNS